MSTVVEVRSKLLYADYGRTLAIDEDAEALFDTVCEEFENNRIEQDPEGNVSIMAPTGGESSFQESELNMQLGVWAKQDGRGRALSSEALFILPDRSRLFRMAPGSAT